ncbi:MAG: AsmA family protein [Hyphomicrobium sp.]|jgi:AsmA protein
MTSGAGAETRRGRGGVVLRILGVTVLGAIVALSLLMAFPPVDLIKDQLAHDIGEATGRTITIGEARLSFTYEPNLVAEFDRVAISNPVGMPAGKFLGARQFKAKIELLPLLKGRFHIASLDLVEPKFQLEVAADGQRNWVFAAKGGKGDGLRFPPSVVIEEASVSLVNAKSGTSGKVEDINAVVSQDGVTGAASLKGTLLSRAERVAFNGTLADSYAAAGGRTSALKLAIDSRHIKADFVGDAQFTAAAEFDGTLEGSTASLLDLANWLGFEVAASGEPLKSSLAGKIKTTTRDVTFAGTDIMINGISSRLDGRLDFSGARPKLEGTIAAERIDLGRIGGKRRQAAAPEALTTAAGNEPLSVEPAWDLLLTDLEALEAGPAASAAPAAPEKASPASAEWSEQPFNFKAIKALDLDVLVTANEVGYGALDLKQARIKAAVTDGVLDAKLEGLDVGAGKATGTLNLDSRATPPRAAVMLSMTDVAAEPIISELTGKPLLSGTSNVEIVAKAVGQNQNQLASTLEGKARFSMAKGAVRGFDVRRMISEWWRNWKFDLAMKTGFEKLDAQYDIKKGVLKSEPGLELGGSEVEINSVGDVNVPARRINQEIRVKVVPPPTSVPIPVRISGSWSKPSIGIDWGGLFSSASADLGGPQQIQAAADPPPPAVEAAIRRVLDANLPPERLSEQGKAMLRSLLALPQAGTP